MKMSDLAKVFGAATPWVLTITGLFFAGLVVVAFRQGRQIWGIGPRPPTEHPPAESPQRADSAAVDGLTTAGRPAEPVDREYPVDRARDFYQQIAPYYDQRNSGGVVSTHLATVRRVRAIRTQQPALRVLDLGGGTGKGIAVHFFDDPEVSWTYVDFCDAMAEQFRNNLDGYPLGRNSKVMVDDITRALRQLPAASYDVVLLSLVLSSMRTPPDFVRIAQVLAPGGSLIVTDINPGYTHANPRYRVQVDGGAVALQTTPVDPFEVIQRAEAAGLQESQTTAIGKGEGGSYYSFMLVFTATATQPTEEERNHDLLRM